MGSRLKTVLLLVFLFGLPVIAVAPFVLSAVRGQAVAGPQPGGLVAGHVRDPAGLPLEGIRVRLVQIPLEGAPREEPSTSTDREGSFRLEAPPLTGFYMLKTGNGLWQTNVRNVSFLDRSGRAVDPSPIAITLEPGSQLDLVLARRDGRSAGDGEYVLEQDAGDRFPFSLFPRRLVSTGEIRGGTFHAESLRPVAADLRMQMASGESVELTLDLAPGENRKRIEF